MKKHAMHLVCFFLCSLFLVALQGQEITALNRFQYINVPPLKYNISNPETGAMTTVYDVYGVQAIILKTLRETGIEVLQKSSQLDDEMRMDCRIGHCKVYHTSELDPNIIDGIIITFSGCNYNTVYTCQAKVKSMDAKRVTTAIAAGKVPIQQATHEALSELSGFKYQYDANNAFEKIESRVSDMNKKEIIAHFKSQENDFDQIEGVYASTDVDAYFIELAIMKNGQKYDIIVLESEDESWKPGQIRGILRNTEDEVYSGSYFYTKDYKLQLEISKADKKNYIFTFVDLAANEYFTIEFKKKFPK
jgi:hypothetical protein